MNIPKYWAKSGSRPVRVWGRTIDLAVWEWSNTSMAEAQRKAEAHLNETAQRLEAGKGIPDYPYGERVLREEIVQTISNAEGAEVGIITRNAYGALIMNAAGAMFIDIDFPEVHTSLSPRSLFNRLLGIKPSRPDPEPEAVARVLDWAQQHPDLGLRIYRTCAGLRCLVTSQVFDPNSADTHAILTALHSDPLYVRLCRQQSSFRARLTPKPWRIGAGLPGRYPRISSEDEDDHRLWLRTYEQAGLEVSVCRLVTSTGPQTVHPDIAPILTLHDQLTRLDQRTTLA
ncbi:MAG: hypothetical protein IPK19_29245 [Chloroflexi bacterium]|nr:hypothetical protein [Chloroflexota bacterium]